MDAESDDAFANCANQMGIATLEQLEQARKAQADEASHGKNLPLSEILLRQGIITEALRANIDKRVQLQRDGIQQLGNYKLIKKLGEGGMGAVFLAEDALVQRRVALKVLPQKLASVPALLSRFRREAKATGRLNHRNIVSAYTVDEDAGVHYYVMEYCDGEPLDAILKRERVLPWRRAIFIAAQVAEGLKHAHEHGFVHRDIKPANILITRDDVAKILDLGLSKDISGAEQSFSTQTGTILGTPQYLAPEQARGDKEIDGRADIYSLGATLFHLVTGHTPFEGPSAAIVVMKHLQEPVPDPRKFNDSIPARVAELIRSMLAKNPGERHATCTALLFELEEALAQPDLETKSRLPGVSTQTMLKPPPVAAPVAEASSPLVKAGAEPLRASNHEPERRRRAVPLGYLAATVVAGIIVALVVLKLRGGGERNNVVATPPPSPQVPPQQTPQVPPPADPPSPPPAPVAVKAPADPWAKALNLMTLIDIEKDRVRGAWTRSERGISSDNAGDWVAGGARVQIPFEPPEEYDFRVRFTRDSGLHCVIQIFPVRRNPIGWVMGGWNNSVFGFELVNGGHSNTPQNSTAVKRAACLTTGREHVSELRVRKNQVTAYLDGELIGRGTANYENMTGAHWYRLPDLDCLGVASWASPTTFHAIEILEVSGQGKCLRPGDAAARDLRQIENK